MSVIKKFLLLATVTLLSACTASSDKNDASATNDLSRIMDLQRIQRALVGGDLSGTPFPSESGCITDIDEDGGVNFSPYIDDLYGSVPVDPKSFSRLNYANGVSCNGQYYYKINPNKKDSFSLYAIVEDWDNANTTCENALEGIKDTEGKGARCYAIFFH